MSERSYPLWVGAYSLSGLAAGNALAGGCYFAALFIAAAITCLSIWRLKNEIGA